MSCVQGVLEDLRRELNSTDLLPGDRLSEVGSMVTQLESQADDNQHIIDTLQDQVPPIHTHGRYPISPLPL